VEAADSLVLNPHKWMGTGFDCSAYYVRDPQHLVRVMSTNPSYLRTAHEGEVKNFRDWGIPLGRRFRALKLWFLIHEQGVKGLQARLRRDLANAQWLKARVDAAQDWQRMAPVQLQTVCLRHLLPGRGAADVDVHNQGLAQRVNASGVAYVTPAVVRGVQLIRVSIGAEGTEQKHVEQAWAALQQAARA
jgi:glutamate/tyrosine decarboxylase-like PLP-dependent enzyme